MIPELEEHRQYLGDAARMSAFRSAISLLVDPGDTVVDLGSGTGILGFLACQAGASKVYSIEQTSFIEAARIVAAENGYGDRITFIKGHSTEVVLPERVDVLLCDQLGYFGVGAGLPEFYIDAVERFLKPDGKILPSLIELLIAPVEMDGNRPEIDFWFSEHGGIDFSHLGDLAATSPYPMTIERNQLLAQPQTVAALDLRTAAHGLLKLRAQFEVNRLGVLGGIGGWFQSNLCRHVNITNSPIYDSPINRAGIILPLGNRTLVKRGDRIHCRLVMRTDCDQISWEVEIRDRTGIVKEPPIRSNWLGPPITMHELRLTDREFKPRLTQRGSAVRAVLNLSHRNFSIAEIEDIAIRAFPALFPTRESVSRFVARTLNNLSI